MSFPWLTTSLLVPLAGAVVVMLLPRRAGAVLAKQVALAFSVLTLVVAVVVALLYDVGGDRYQLVEEHQWIASFGAHYALGVDGIGLTLVLLTAILTPVVIVASWHDGDTGRWSASSFFAWILVLEGLAIGVFAATDVFLFYVLFEATLIPIYFLIGGFGGPRRSYAAVKFLLYSLLGGLLMLASVVGLYALSADTAGGPTYLLSELSRMDFGTVSERWLFLGFFVAFAIKAPMFPVHTWLPDAASQGTAGTSVAVVSVLYGALLAIGQNNIPRLIAYTSVSHFGFIVLGIFVMNSYGQSGATLYMFNHGLSTAALFLVTGFLIRRRGSQLISDFGGVEKVAPVLAGTFLVAGLSSLSLPGLSPFVSEFLVLVGTFSHNWWYAVFAVLGIVLAALYILLMYQRTMTGIPRPELLAVRDLSLREVSALAPLVLLIVLLGFYPKPLTDIINPAVTHTLQQANVKDPAPDVPASSAQAPGAEQESHQ